MNDYLINQRKSSKHLAYSVLAHVYPYFGHLATKKITPTVLNQYKNFRKEQKAANATINRELAAIRRAFSLGISREKILVAPKVEMLKENPPRAGFLNEADFHKLYKHFDSDLRPMIRFAYITGWRRGEILNLQWRNIDWKEGEVRLDPGSTKNDSGRVFPMTPDLHELLKIQRIRSEENTQWVFHRNGQKIRNFRGAWDTACTKAEVKYLFHDLRRTAVRNWARHEDAKVVMELTGHKTRRVFDAYRIVAKSDLQRLKTIRIFEEEPEE